MEQATMLSSFRLQDDDEDEQRESNDEREKGDEDEVACNSNLSVYDKFLFDPESNVNLSGGSYLDVGSFFDVVDLSSEPSEVTLLKFKGSASSPETVAYSCDSYFVSDSQLQLDNLKVHRWPRDPRQLSNEEIKKWIEDFANDNKHISNEVNLLESYWTQHRSCVRDGVHKTSLNDYVEEIMGVRNGVTSTFKTLTEELKEAKPIRRKWSTIAGQSNVTVNTQKPSGFLGRDDGRDDGTRSLMTSNSFNYDRSCVGASLQMGDRIEMAMVEMRRRNSSRRQRQREFEETKDNLLGSTEQKKIQLDKIKSIRNNFDKEVLHERRGGNRTRREKKAITGESVVKFYDDLVKDKHRQKSLIILNNENLKNKYNKVLESLKQHADDRADQTTTNDIKMLKELNSAASKTLEAVNEEYKSLVKLLGESVFNVKTVTKKLEEGEEKLKEQLTKTETMKRLSLKTHIETEAVDDRRRTCISEREICKTLLRSNAGHAKEPEIADYAKLMDRCRQSRREVEVWERKIRIKEMELKNLEKELKNQRRSSRKPANLEPLAESKRNL